jgi:hypothetical protein
MEGEFEHDLELEAEFQHEVHRRHHVYHRHRRSPFLHRRASLLARSLKVPQQDGNPDISDMKHHTKELDAEVIALGHHPAVAKKLKDMDTEVANLKSWHGASNEATSDLEGKVKSSMGHLNKVGAIRNQIAHMKVQIHTQELKLEQLKRDRERLDTTHHDLTFSLQHVMKTKIKFAQARLDRKKEDLEKMQAKAEEWKAKEEKFHASSLAMIEQRDKNQESLELAIANEEKAHRDRILAEKQLELTKKQTNFDVEGYKYTQVRAKAAMAKQKRDEEQVAESEASVTRLDRIFNLEQRRVDQSMAFGKDRVEGKIHRLESDQKKSDAELEDLMVRYKKWQDENERMHEMVISSQQRTSATAQSYDDVRKGVLQRAHAKVTTDYEAGSDWAWEGDWANANDAE